MPPPRPQAGVCATCRTWSDTDTDQCSNCAGVEEQLGRSCLPLSVITLYRKPSVLRDWLTGYKGSVDGSEPHRPEYGSQVAALLGRFVHEHGSDLAHRLGGLDAVVVVPSTDRPPPHPLARLIASRLDLDLPIAPILVRTAGDMGFRRASRQGFAADVSAGELGRILLLDDVYTTGARINSASYAISHAGGIVAGALVLARRINTGYDDRALALWERQQAQGFDWRASPIVGG